MIIPADLIRFSPQFKVYSLPIFVGDFSVPKHPRHSPRLLPVRRLVAKQRNCVTLEFGQYSGTVTREAPLSFFTATRLHLSGEDLTQRRKGASYRSLPQRGYIYQPSN